MQLMVLWLSAGHHTHNESRAPRMNGFTRKTQPTGCHSRDAGTRTLDRRRLGQRPNEFDSHEPGHLPDEHDRDCLGLRPLQ